MKPISGNADQATGTQDLPERESLGYWALVWRRLRRNAYGMVGMIICAFVVLLAVFAGFIAPYSPENSDPDAIYTPPQVIRVLDENGSLTAPHVLPFTEEFDKQTYELIFAPDRSRPLKIRFFVEGDPWTLAGLTFDTHLIGTESGEHVHFLGTDSLGRDVLSRLIHGTRTTLMMGVLVMLASCVIGTSIGIASGYFGGMFDLVVQRLVEFVKSFPDLPLYLALVAVMPRRAEPIAVFLMFAVILVLLRWADLSREIRGKVISIRATEYVDAAIAVGAGDRRIIFRHILPNTSSHVIVWATYQLPEVILLESFLSFLGLGVQAPMVSWGTMLNQVRDFQSLNAAPWMLAPVAMIILSVLAFNAFGDGLRDAMDPYSND
ncbi:ABC transporter permease [Oceaniglobus trochenteri]|uniref:ABC transporter permease n=1 Tax=Oceaniglobus trochenteri TaxID=2763260 RepID=UPI001CFFAB85|nr:ABC transporter permease [Oceaniglobus trochenteri]